MAVVRREVHLSPLWSLQCKFRIGWTMILCPFPDACFDWNVIPARVAGLPGWRCTCHSCIPRIHFFNLIELSSFWFEALLLVAAWQTVRVHIDFLHDKFFSHFYNNHSVYKFWHRNFLSYCLSMLLCFLHWLKKLLTQTLMFNLSEANWIAFPSSNCNQWLLDDSMQLQLVHTVHHSYDWLQKSQFPEHKWFLCCFNSSWIDGKDIFCITVQYSELKFLRGTLHCLTLWTQLDTAILRSLICLKRSIFFFLQLMRCID